MSVLGSSSKGAGQTGCKQILQLVQQQPYFCSHQKSSKIRPLPPDFYYSIHSGATGDIKNREEKMCMAFCTCPSGIPIYCRLVNY